MKKGCGKFVLGALVGFGVGVLFAPRKGKETRAALRDKFKELMERVRDIDIDEVREEFQNKIEKLQKDLRELDREKVLHIARKKAGDIKRCAQELVDLAVEKGSPVLQKAADEVRQRAIDVTKDVLYRLENSDN